MEVVHHQGYTGRLLYNISAMEKRRGCIRENHIVFFPLTKLPAIGILNVRGGNSPTATRAANRENLKGNPMTIHQSKHGCERDTSKAALCPSYTCGDCTRYPAHLRHYAISDIADHNQKAGGHYFDRSTLAFFNQRRSDFRAYTSPSGRVFIHGASSRPFMHTYGLTSTAEYFPETGDISNHSRQ
jgi:hypothetical protein